MNRSRLAPAARLKFDYPPSRLLRCGIVLAALLWFTGAARAQTLAERFATAFRVSPAAVSTISGFTLPPGIDTTHFLIGRYTEGGYTHPSVLLMRCNATQCLQQRIWFEPNSEPMLLGVVDLRGGPGLLTELPAVYLPVGKSQFTALAAPNHPRWPALVVRTKWSENTTSSARFVTATGAHVKESITIISLLSADADSPELLREDIEERYPTGNGQETELRLAGSAQPLVLIGSTTRYLDNHSECLAPKPFPVRYVLREEPPTTTHDGKPGPAAARRFERDRTLLAPRSDCH